MYTSRLVTYAESIRVPNGEDAGTAPASAAEGVHGGQWGSVYQAVSHILRTEMVPF